MKFFIKFPLPQILSKLPRFLGNGLLSSKFHNFLNFIRIFNLFEPNCLVEQIVSNYDNRPFMRVIKIGKKWSKYQIMVKLT